ISLHRYKDGICAFFNDDTAIWQAEQSLRKTVDELQRSNQNLEQFAYVASHDLQEPLRKLIGFGEILASQHQASLGEEGLKLLQRMQSATQRMHTLIRDLLSFSRLTSANHSFKRINLQAIVDEVLNDLEPIIREKKAVLDVTSLPYLEGDAGQLGQLFQNLLSNALKFVRPGEIPLIRIDCEVITGSGIESMPGTTVLATDLNRSFFAIIVSDNGIGFDEKYRDRIFTIFQRLHTRAEYPGTGIGLAVVQRVVDNHKGYLNVRSELGKGAEFTIYLPDEPALPEMASDL
ncbi:MAG: histidine kinase, partial [Bacteroidetes bacterium]|nr:histidine kinase [Fibrella sp.]